MQRAGRDGGVVGGDELLQPLRREADQCGQLRDRAGGMQGAARLPQQRIGRLRMAAAGLEAVGKQSVKNREWLTRLRRMQNGDGGWPETTRPSGNLSYAEHISTTAWALYALVSTGS